MDNLLNAFDQKASQWQAYTQTPKGQLRESLNLRYLKQHLPQTPATILDVGAGTGSFGIRLASEGYTVHLLDFSSEMLAIAASQAAANSLHVTIHVADLSDFVAPSQGFDVICCHTIFAYVPDLVDALTTVVQWIRPGGMLSVVFVNRHVDVLKAAILKGDWNRAHAQLTLSAADADLFGVPRNVFDSETMLGALKTVGMAPVAEYGVRIFTDFNTHQQWQHDEEAYQALLTLETDAAALPTFRRIGRYGQIIAKRA